jgi:hypothetical protein
LRSRAERNERKMKGIEKMKGIGKMKGIEKTKGIGKLEMRTSMPMSLVLSFLGWKSLASRETHRQQEGQEGV